MSADRTPYDSGDVVDALTRAEPLDVRGAWLGWARTLVPVWRRGLDEHGRLRDDASATARLLEWADGAFDLLDAWHDGEPVIKARVREIERAIAGLRPGGAFQPAAGRLFVPVCQHVARALQPAVRITTGAYREDAFAHVAASGLLDLAAARTVFPLSLGDLTQVWVRTPRYDQGAHHAGRAYHRPLVEAAPGLELGGPAEEVLAEAARLWSVFWGEPEAVVVPEEVWTAPDLGWNADLARALDADVNGRLLRRARD
ncbi:hypothetical protein [Actinotalea solisilvae]|uniref:hypothetical protein n=1 Tax=Actinotalea solisilvae TaxID=2072922 RepID=UPI0018F16F31|nr:hypothetical protein [Actinotalea solisilvae]